MKKTTEPTLRISGYTQADAERKLAEAQALLDKFTSSEEINRRFRENYAHYIGLRCVFPSEGILRKGAIKDLRQDQSGMYLKVAYVGTKNHARWIRFEHVYVNSDLDLIVEWLKELDETSR